MAVPILRLNVDDNPHIIVKQDNPTTIITGTTGTTTLIGSGATIVNNLSGNTWVVYSEAPSGNTWGSITGDINNQTDLINYISGVTSGLTSSWSGLTGLPSDNSDLVDYVQSEITGASTTLVGSGGTWTGLLSGTTWVVYSPDWTADILGLTMSAQTAYECCTGNTADIAYISGVTDNHYDSFTGLSSYVINLLVPAISGNTNDINYLSGITSGHTLDISYLSGQTEIAQQCCTGLTETFNTYTGDTFITLSGITVAGALLQAQTNNLQQAFTGHTGTTGTGSIHFTGHTFTASGGTVLGGTGDNVIIYSPTGGTDTTVLVGSGATIVDNISGTTWVVYSPTGGTSSVAFSGLTDTVLTGITNLDYVRFDSGATKWINEQPTDIFINVDNLELLQRSGDTIVGYTLPTMVTGTTSMGGTSIIHSIPISAGKLQLKGLSAADTKITVTDATTYLSIGLGTVTLDNLSDVVITSAAANQIIRNNGTNWVNETMSDIFQYVSDGQLLARNSTNITGVTNQFSSKLNISTFTGYTGTTVPATYAKLYPVTKDVTETTYTALAADVGKNIEFSNTGATTITLPTGLTAGYEIRCINIGGQAITFAAGGGATVNSKAGNLKLITQYTTAQALYRGNNNWLIISPDLTA